MRLVAFAFAVAGCLGSLRIESFAQAAATPSPSAAPVAAEAAYAGCVMRSALDKDTLVLNAESVCATLTGEISATRFAGHEVDLKGVLTPGTSRIPASIRVGSVVSVGKSCSEMCSPHPPGGRGLGGEKPGKEGGTPGLAPTNPPPPKQ